MLLIVNAQMPVTNVNADVSRKTRGSNLGLILHIYPYYIFANSKCSGDCVHMRRLVQACVDRGCDKYRILCTMRLVILTCVLLSVPNVIL